MVTRYSGGGGTTSSTTIDSDPLVPTTGPPGDFNWIDGKTTTSSRSVSVSSGTRKSDGASRSSSPANYYDQGTIEAWSWSGSWSAGIRISSSHTNIRYSAFPDTSWDGGPGSFVSRPVTTAFWTGAGSGGGIGGCSRTLVVAPPTCTAKLRTHPDNGSWPVAHLPATTETFNPYVEHGAGGQSISVFPVGTDSRSHLNLRNRKNLFELASSGSSYSYSGASPYNSGRSPSVGGREYWALVATRSWAVSSMGRVGIRSFRRRSNRPTLSISRVSTE